jgi:hypothetical protein
MAITVEDCSGCGLSGWGWQDDGYGVKVLGTGLYFNGGPTIVRVQRREDGISIDQIVLARDDFRNDTPYFTAAPGYQKDDTTILPEQDGDTATDDPSEIVLYAGVDGATLHGGWTAIADSSAAGGTRLTHPNAGAAKLAAPLASPAHYFELTFQAEAGVGYRLWIRGKADSNHWSNDSVYVQFSGSVTASGAPTWRIGTTSATIYILEDCNGCGVKGWGWNDNGYGTLGADVYFDTTGTHTIRLQRREDGLTIDQIVLSSGTYLNTSPGAAKNDTTILGES